MRLFCLKHLWLSLPRAQAAHGVTRLGAAVLCGITAVKMGAGAGSADAQSADVLIRTPTSRTRLSYVLSLMFFSHGLTTTFAVCHLHTCLITHQLIDHASDIDLLSIAGRSACGWSYGAKPSRCCIRLQHQRQRCKAS